MTLSLFLVWVVLISLLTIAASYYAKRYNKSDALTALFVTLVVFANITASKTISFNLGFTQIFAPAAVIIFAVTFLLTDIVNEKFGRHETQKMIAIALGCQVAITIFSYLILKASPAPFFQNQTAFQTVLGNIPRIIFASLLAFFVSENADAYIFAWFRKLTGGKHLWMRNAFSSAPAMVIDSAIFITIAFWGAMPVLPLIIGQSIIKWLVAVIDIPFMYLARKVLGKET
jgi:queuosine precursor transporter